MSTTSLLEELREKEGKEGACAKGDVVVNLCALTRSRNWCWTAASPTKASTIVRTIGVEV